MAAKAKKILFIEDEPDQVMMVKLRLEKNGFSVVTARSGEEGLQKAKVEKPDLVLLDILMPGIDGFEVCRTLKKDPVTQDVPVIATTAVGVDDLEHKVLTAGADACVRKPYDASDLILKIKELLGN